MKFKNIFAQCGFALVAMSSVLLPNVSKAVTIPNEPLTVQASAIPLIMLAFGRDHRMFYEAYNDSSDIDGDGTLDIRFKPSITYLGLFDSNICYVHSGGNNGDSNNGEFSPSSAAVGALKTCSGKWSGNWLNYVTTSRIDALRVVLYGGMRDVDTGSKTVLRRAYIPQDAHSWAKEYTSEAVDGYKISDYTPLAQPNANRRHFFGNLTPNASTNCDPLNNCSDLPPWLSVVENSTTRVWEWASTERPVLRDGTHSGTRTNYTVRVEICTETFRNADCKLYPNGKYKPVGLLHDFGETDAAYFGMFSGSYDSHLSGGRLRKVMSSFKNEVNDTNGMFSNVDGIVKNLNSFRLYGFNRGRTDQIYTGGVIGNRVINQGEFPDWGNPVAELMYEATRYLANKGVATGAFTGSTTLDDIIGLSKPDWDRPYDGQGMSTAKAPYCSRATLLTVSDTNISFDSDQLPGAFSAFVTSTFSTDLSGRNIFNNSLLNLNVSTIADTISSFEPSVTGLKFIGQSGTTFDSAPTAKTVGSLASIRGLAPEEPTKRGSYYAASVAHFAKTHDLNAGLQKDQTVDNFFVALASPLPRIEAKLPNNRVITLVPFAKSVGGAFSISNAKTAYQPTNQIVDFYVERIANSGAGDQNASVNDGRYEAVFRINYEDVEQGNDHDMDAIAVYTVRALADNSLEVIVQPIYQAGGVKHRMGYIISGSTNDGTYLVTQDESETNLPYFLNVPPGRSPGYCDQATPPGDCSRLPYLGGSTTITATASLAAATSSISRFVFTASTAAAATFLKDPMWFGAKWGGFTESTTNKNGRPDLAAEWDFDGDGQPDTYFFVQNPTKLKTSLSKAFKAITERQSSASNLAASSTSSETPGALLYRANYTAGKWIGDVEGYPITASNISVPRVWSAKERLPAWNSRAIYMAVTTTVATVTPTLLDTRVTPFTALPSTVQSELLSTTIYNYVRGEVSNEVRSGGNLRDRDSLIGDIIHSSPLYDDDSGLFYIGSNGGMLHAFDGKTGTETFAIVPRQVIPRLKNLASTTYDANHEYFVDGAVIRSFKAKQTNGNRYIYSLLGRGGKGLFSINPRATGGTASPQLLWEYTPLGSSAAASDPDLGFMLGAGQFVLLNNGKVGLVVGNGYNSVSTKAVLYIFIINADGTLDSVKKLDTGVAGDNGMTGATFYDKTGDFVADYLYAGDLKGNMWKFDVSDADPANWSVAGGGLPFFKAVGPSGTPQPITTQPWAVFNNFGADSNTINKIFVYFGTGSYFKSGDSADLNVQSWYGIIDADTTSTVAPLRADLVERSITSYATLTSALGVNVGVRYIDQAAPNDMAGKRGWYLDFDNPINGERITSRSILEKRTIRPALFVSSFYPITNDQCVPGGDSWINAIDPFSGANLGVELFPGLGLASSVDLNVGIASTPLIISPRIGSDSGIAPSNIVGDGGGGGCTGSTCSKIPEICLGAACKEEPPNKDCLGNPVLKIPGSDDFASVETAGCAGNLRGRISWREIIRD
jgi:type IV pilus assembly protein PilY1